MEFRGLVGQQIDGGGHVQDLAHGVTSHRLGQGLVHLPPGQPGEAGDRSGQSQGDQVRREGPTAALAVGDEAGEQLLPGQQLDGQSDASQRLQRNRDQEQSGGGVPRQAYGSEQQAGQLPHPSLRDRQQNLVDVEPLAH